MRREQIAARGVITMLLIFDCLLDDHFNAKIFMSIKVMYLRTSETLSLQEDSQLRRHPFSLTGPDPSRSVMNWFAARRLNCSWAPLGQ